MESFRTICAAILVWTLVASTEANNVNMTQLLALPPCVQTCGAKFTAQYDCLPTEPCYCVPDSPMQEAIAACVETTCDAKTATAGGIMGLRFQADTCDWPIRSQTTRIVVVTWTLFALSSLFLVVRILSRQRWLKGAGMGWDDWTVIAAYPFVIGMTVVGYYEPNYGSGKDVWRVPVEDLQPFLKWYYVGEPIYHGTVFLTKLSMVFLYMRIWPERPRRWFGWGCIIVAVLLVMALFGVEVPSVFSCRPISYNWTEKFGGEGWCTDRTAAVYAYSGINIAFDVVVLTLPIPRLWELNLSWTHKTGIFTVFLVGFVVTACSIVRVTTVSGLENTTNPTWDFVPVAMWSLIEVYCSLIVACMPAMAGVFKRSWKYAGSWRSHSTRPTTTSVSFGGPPAGSVLKPKAGLPSSNWSTVDTWQQDEKFDPSWVEPPGSEGSLSPPPLRPRRHPAPLPPTAPLPAIPKDQQPWQKRTSNPEARPSTHQSDMYFHDGENFLGFGKNENPRTQPTTPQLFSLEEGNVHSELIPSTHTTPYLNDERGFEGFKKRVGPDLMPLAHDAVGKEKPKRESDKYRTR